jgi:hypothetical protein
MLPKNRVYKIRDGYICKSAKVQWEIPPRGGISHSNFSFSTRKHPIQSYYSAARTARCSDNKLVGPKGLD